MLNVLFYGLPIEQLQSFRSRVNAVQPDDIERAARSYLKPDRLSVVLVGNAAAFVPQLRALGFNTYEVVEMNNLDLMAADFKRAGAGPRASEAADLLAAEQRRRRAICRRARRRRSSLRARVARGGFSRK